MRILIDWKGETGEVECDENTTISHVLSSVRQVNHLKAFMKGLFEDPIDNSGAVVICNQTEWRLFKEDLLNYKIKILNVKDGDMLIFNDNPDEDDTFIMPNVAGNSRMHNLIASISLGKSPNDALAEKQISIDGKKIHDLLRDAKYKARWTWMAPALVRYYIHHPDDFGGFLIGFKEWKRTHGEKMVRLDQAMATAMEHNPETFTPITMLYIKGLLNNHEIVAFIDTGAQHTIISESVARACGIYDLIDARFRTINRGVGGESRSLGKIFGIDLHLSAGMMSLSPTVLLDKATTGTNFILGLDVLLRHGCTLDLRNRTLSFDGHIVPLLSVSETEQMTEFGAGPEQKKQRMQ